MTILLSVHILTYTTATAGQELLRIAAIAEIDSSFLTNTHIFQCSGLGVAYQFV